MTSFNCSKWLIRCYQGTCTITLSLSNWWSVWIKDNYRDKNSVLNNILYSKRIQWDLWPADHDLKNPSQVHITFCTRILLEEAKRHHPKGTVEWTMVVTRWYSVVRMGPSPYYLLYWISSPWETIAIQERLYTPYNQSGWIFSRIRTFRSPYRIQSTAYSTPYHY